MSKIGIANNFIRQCLASIRKTRGLIQLKLRIDPFMADAYKLQTLNDKLKQIQCQTQQLLLSRKIAPPIVSCSPLATTAMMVSQLLPIWLNKNDNQQLMVSMQKCQDVANDNIRQLNQQQLEENQVRQILIGYRNSLQEYTQHYKTVNGRYTDGVYSKLIKFIL